MPLSNPGPALVLSPTNLFCIVAGRFVIVPVGLHE